MQKKRKNPRDTDLEKGEPGCGSTASPPISSKSKKGGWEKYRAHPSEGKIGLKTSGAAGGQPRERNT